MGRKLSDVRRQRKSSAEQRRARVAKLYHSGWLVQDIATAVKAHRETIRKDLACLQAQWLDSQKALYAQRQIRELQRLDVLESENWDAWQQSKEVSLTEMDEQTVGGKDGGKSVTRAVRRHQVGDPRFLTELRRIVEARCRILGLFVKENGEPGDGSDTQQGPAELRKILAEMTNAELEAISAPYRKYREQFTRRFSGLN